MRNEMSYSNINFDFNEHIVLVSGGSRGIGKGVVDAFLLSGAKVLYASRHPMKNAESNDAIHIPIDLTEEAEIEKLFEVVDSYGIPNILINAAAINFTKKNEDISIDNSGEITINSSKILSNKCKLRIINTTTDSSKTARLIAESLVEKDLSPCVQTIKNIKSI